MQSIPSPLHSSWSDRLQTRETDQQRRRLRTPLAIDFCSNDYLGWAKFGNNLHSCANHYGFNIDQHGATGSRLLSGQAQAISDLEAHIAQFHDAPAALLFNSGFDANMGTLAAISDRHTVFIYDELCHASLIDGMRLSMSRHHFKFRHNDVVHFSELLTQHQHKPICVVLESVYSMDGDIAPLAMMVELAKQHNACIVVDEAHATGVIGRRGEGLVQHLNLHHQVDVRIHTYGKAIGCHGAAVIGSQLLIDTLINFARPFIYSTALPPASYAAIAHAYQGLADDGFSNQTLHALIQSFRTRIAAVDWADFGSIYWLDSHTPIQGLVIGNVERTHRITKALHDAQLDVRPIFSPTVAAGSERLRICLHAFNTEQELDVLFATLCTALN